MGAVTPAARKSVPFCLSGALSGLLWLVLSHPAPLSAQPPAPPAAPSPAPGTAEDGLQRTVERRLEGFYWDSELWLGAGARLRSPLTPAFVAQLRWGGMWASEPFTLNAGLVAEVGGLAELGGGLELACNHLDGWFAAANVALSRHGFGVASVRAGYWVFGLAYERRFDAFQPRPSGGGVGALLAIVRLPFGLSAAVKDTATTALAALAATSASEQPTAPLAPTRDPKAARNALVRAERSRDLKNFHALDQALQEAFAADPQASTLEQLFTLRKQRAQWMQAAEFLAAALRNQALELSAPARDTWEKRLHGLRKDIPVLRIDPEGLTADVRFLIDGERCRGVFQGYDCSLNPGPHVLELRGPAAELLWSHRFFAEPGALVRLRILEHFRGAAEPQ